MKKILFILAIMLMLGCLNTTNWKETPEYSLLQVKDAIEKNDIILFKKHFDIDQVSENICNEVIYYQKDRLNADTDTNDLFDVFGTNFALGVLELAKPLLIPIIANNITKNVETGYANKFKTESIPGLSNLSFLSEITYTLLNILEVNDRSVHTNNVTTRIMISLNKDGKTFEIEIILNKHDDYWKIIEIRNIAELISFNK